MTLYAGWDGVNWKENSNRKTGVDVCEWYGITCIGEAAAAAEAEVADTNNEQRHRRLQTARDDAIQSLVLNNNKLEGLLPPDIILLTSLENLEIHENNINGNFPPEIGSLSKLEYLDVNQNQFEGSLPVALGNLADLEV